jgi:hypothetical protein
MYRGVPTDEAFTIFFVIFFFAKPKSPILITPFDNNKFAGFTSLNNQLITDDIFLLLPKLKNHYKFVLKNRLPHPQIYEDFFAYISPNHYHIILV